MGQATANSPKKATRVRNRHQESTPGPTENLQKRDPARRSVSADREPFFIRSYRSEAATGAICRWGRLYELVCRTRSVQIVMSVWATITEYGAADQAGEARQQSDQTCTQTTPTTIRSRDDEAWNSCLLSAFRYSIAVGLPLPQHTLSVLTTSTASRVGFLSTSSTQSDPQVRRQDSLE